MKRWTWTWMVLLLIAAVAGLALLGPPAARWGHDQFKQARMGDHEALIEHHARQAGLSAELVRAVVFSESGGDASATSHRDARGLMQITPITEREVHRQDPHLGRGDLYDPDYNLRVGTHYLAYLLERFERDLPLALTAYHMGPTRVARIQRAHPHLSTDALIAHHAGPQTRAYVRAVLERM